MVYKFESVKGIVDGLYRDFDSPQDLELWDIIEWCAEALELIGAGTQYVDRFVEMGITNHAIQLPCDFHTLMQISYKGRPLTLNVSTVGPGPSPDIDGLSNTWNTKDVSQDNFPQAANDPENGGLSSYYIQNNCLVTSFEEGEVVMAYKAIQTDEEGYPMIPDDVYFRKALKSYCQMVMDRKGWRKGTVSNAVYKESKDDWLFYVKAAAASAMFPNLDQVENIKNSWVRLKPNINQHDTFFSGLNIREIKKHK